MFFDCTAPYYPHISTTFDKFPTPNAELLKHIREQAIETIKSWVCGDKGDFKIVAYIITQSTHYIHFYAYDEYGKATEAIEQWFTTVNGTLQ